MPREVFGSSLSWCFWSPSMFMAAGSQRRGRCHWEGKKVRKGAHWPVFLCLASVVDWIWIVAGNIGVLESLGMACRCCDGARGECRSDWESPCAKVECHPFKYLWFSFDIFNFIGRIYHLLHILAMVYILLIILAESIHRRSLDIFNNLHAMIINGMERKKRRDYSTF